MLNGATLLQLNHDPCGSGLSVYAYSIVAHNPQSRASRSSNLCEERLSDARVQRTQRAGHESQKRLRRSTHVHIDLRSQLSRRRRAAFLWLAPAPQRAGAARADRHVGQLLCHLELAVDSSEPRVCTETRAGTQWARSVYAACPMRSRVCTQASTRWGGVGVPRVVRVEWGGGGRGGGGTGASLVADLEPCERPYVGREEGKVLRVHLRCSLVTAFLGQQRTECLAHRDQPAVRLVVGQGIEPDARRRCCGLKKDRV